MRAAGQEPEMPPVLAGEHLIAHLFDVGPVMHSGMGPCPVSWGELAAWQAATGVELTPWEAQMLRQLSANYIAAQQAGESATAPAPYSTVPTAEKLALVDQRLGSFLGAMAGNRKRQG